MFDFHTHTNNSSDSSQSIEELCNSAIKKGLSGIAITDHVDMWFTTQNDYHKIIKNSISDAERANEKFFPKLEIFKGIELAEYLFDPKKADIILNCVEFDVILGSVHSVEFEDIKDSYSKIDFGNNFSEIKIHGFLKKYFEKVYEMALKTDIDILTHLTCPLRYINGKYNREISLEKHMESITDIFSTIIKRNICLEVNTSGYGLQNQNIMPDFKLIKLYKNMGGKLISLGSDAHIPQNVANGFYDVSNILRSIGFTEYYYFRKRIPTAHPLPKV